MIGFISSNFYINSRLALTITAIILIPVLLIIIYLKIIKNDEEPFISVEYFLKKNETVIYSSVAWGARSSKTKTTLGKCYITQKRFIFIPTDHGRFYERIYEMFIPLKNIISISKINSYGHFKIITKNHEYYIDWINEKKWISLFTSNLYIKVVTPD